MGSAQERAGGGDAPEAFADTVMTGLGDDNESLGKIAQSVVATGTPDRYRVNGVIGEGGMGRVLDATDLWFGRRVALKEILADAAPLALTRRFLIEALVTGNLEHPGIVAVHERGVREGRPYYVMRKLGGRTLADALDAAKTFSERLAFVPMLVRVAQTIAFAHERGVIHRDLKPENIILGSYGEVTVIDWGIARVRKLDHLGLGEASAPLVASGAAEWKTVAGAVVGTPAYMAPEQAASKLDAVDERTDVFALGALLYHVLSGRAPYEGPTAESLMSKALTVEYPDLVSVEKKVPTALADICARAMAKEPADRFQSAKEMSAALDSAMTDALTVRESRFVNVFAGAISVSMLVLGGVGCSYFIWKAVPEWQAMGSGVELTTVATVLGLVLGMIELYTKGRNRLSGLVLTFVAVTFLGGLLGTGIGFVTTLRAILAPEIMNDALRYREILTEGVYEASGNVIIGAAMAGLQLLIWAVGHRRTTARERTSNEQKGTYP